MKYRGSICPPRIEGRIVAEAAGKHMDGAMEDGSVLVFTYPIQAPTHLFVMHTGKLAVFLTERKLQ